MTNEFKKLPEVEIIDTMTENTNVIVEDNGMVRRASMALFGSGAVSDEQIGKIVDAVIEAIEENGYESKILAARMIRPAWVGVSCIASV